MSVLTPLTAAHMLLRAVGRKRSNIHDVADSFERQVFLVVNAAFLRGRKAYKSGGIDAAIGALRSGLFVGLPKLLAACLAAGGTVAVGSLDRGTNAAPRAAEAGLRALKPSASAKVSFAFDAKNKATVTWAKKHAAELIDDVTETSRKRIKAAIVNVVEGEDFNTQYDRILAAVGDDDRAYLIARHESMLAASEGQRQAWDQATEAGLLTGKEKRTWITTPDERLCEICEELDGATADMDGEYPGGYDGPPAHVQCRCTEGLTTARSAEFNPDQPRDENGQWTAGGSGSASERLDRLFSGDNAKLSRAVPEYGLRIDQPLITKSEAEIDEQWKDYDTRSAFDLSAAKVKDVPISQIDFIRETVYKSQIENKLKNRDPVADGNAFEANGRFYLIDGNHRVVAENLKGNQVVRLRVIQSEKIAGKKWNQSKRRYLAAGANE